LNEDKATRYQRIKRRSDIAGLLWTVLLLGGLAASGWTVALRQAAESIARHVGDPGAWPSLVVCAYVTLLLLINETVALPMAFYTGFVVERRYGLSNETFAGWAVDQMKSLAIGLVFGCGGATLVYAIVRLSPDRWWLWAGAVFAMIVVGLVNLAPVLLLPIFYSVKPLDRESLRRRLLALAERAGARVLGAYEWGLAEKTRKANAALTGLGGTRRILVSDTMLAEYSDDEIEVVLAHELAHHVHGDIWKGIVFESALILGGFYAAARVLSAFAGFRGLRGVADPAGLPLLLLAAGAVSIVMLPAAYAMSRAHERKADRFALQLTKNPGAFISAMRRLGAQNLAEDNPSKLVQWLFYSHPPIRERIAAAQTFPAR
jgi:Zn-dependent protease with chaperone function